MIFIGRFSIWFRDRKLSRAYQRIIEESESRGEAETARALSELDKEQAQLEELRGMYIQSKLLRKARRLLLPSPNFERDESGKYKNWIESSTLFKKVSAMVMKAEVLTKFREDIRRETAARRDFVLGYIMPLMAIVTGFIGIIGALTGLFAVLLSQGSHSTRAVLHPAMSQPNFPTTNPPALP